MEAEEFAGITLARARQRRAADPHAVVIGLECYFRRGGFATPVVEATAETAVLEEGKDRRTVEDVDIDPGAGRSQLRKGLPRDVQVIAERHDAARCGVKDTGKGKKYAGCEDGCGEDDSRGRGEPARAVQAVDGKQEEIAGDRSPVEAAIQLVGGGNPGLSAAKDEDADGNQGRGQQRCAGAGRKAVPSASHQEQDYDESEECEEGNGDRLHACQGAVATLVEKKLERGEASLQLRKVD